MLLSGVTVLDWGIIAGFLLLSLLIGLKYRKEGSKNVTAFFLGGRNLPWYLVGLSMVATTFAADTPLAVTELVGDKGISSNWIWWSFLIGGTLTTFFFAHLWRRAGILTELEFLDLRYAGKPARWLRLFKAGYLGLLMNVMVIAWVNAAMAELLQEFFGLSGGLNLLTIAGITTIALLYSSLSGLKGVIITDAFQFVLAMGGCIILAFIVVNSEEVGGMDQLVASLPEGTTSFFPQISSETDGVGVLTLSLGAMLAFVGVQWWASWYPGGEPGGGGYIAQRMMSAKDEQHALWATLFFQFAHYCLRPWPWIIVGLCAISLYNPDNLVDNEALKMRLNDESVIELAASHQISPLEQIQLEFPGLSKQETDVAKYHFSKKSGFVIAMNNFLPPGLKGLLLAAFLAAFMSTISTQLNWGASFLTNDLALVIKPELAQDDAKAMWVSKAATVLIAVCGVVASAYVNSIKGVWELLMGCGAGLGLVLILRWYYWRINAWAEIAATLAPLILYPLSLMLFPKAEHPVFAEQYGYFFFTVAGTTITWIVVMLLTFPEPASHLQKFYERTQPDGWWRKIIPTASPKPLIWPLLCWIFSLGAIYGLLFGLGSWLLNQSNSALISTSVGLICTAGLIWSIKALLKHRHSQ